VNIVLVRVDLVVPGPEMKVEPSRRRLIKFQSRLAVRTPFPVRFTS
jgi:hypothetical protein